MGVPQPFCPICGQSMPFDAMQQHELTEHPDIYQPAHAAVLEAHKRYRKLVLPLILVWVVGSLGGLFGGFLHGPEAFFVLALVPTIIAAGGSLYARASVRAFQHQTKTIHVPCTICGVVLPSSDMKAHMKTVHRNFSRYVTLVLDFMWGVISLFFGGFLAIVFLNAFDLLSDADTLLLALALFGFLIGATVWFRTFALHHLLKLRGQLQKGLTG